MIYHFGNIMTTSEEVKNAFQLFDDESDDEYEDQVANGFDKGFTFPSVPFKIQASVSTKNGPKNVLDAGDPTESLWTDHPVMYMKGVEYQQALEDIGGGRGYVAKQDIEAGTLLLMEECYIPWPKNTKPKELFIETMRRSVLGQPKTKQILANLKKLFPSTLAEVPEHVLVEGKKTYEDDLKKLQEEIYDASGPFTIEELLQPVFAMQCSAFGTGVFLHMAIFNHSCNPNCIKYPTDDDKRISEVRATRKIRKGESLSISYLHPREKCRRVRQEKLMTQFGFVCKCIDCNESEDEPEGMVALEEQLEAIEQAAKVEHPAKTLETALDILYDMLQLIRHDHIILCRIHGLVADCCDKLLKLVACHKFKEHSILFLRSSCELYELQCKYYDEDHIDLARTCNDISQGIQSLLSYDPSLLYQEFPDWNSFQTASHVENDYRKKYKRIKSMYE